MTYTERLGICAAASVAVHLLLATSSGHLGPRAEPARPVAVRVELREPAPAPEPEATPAPKPEEKPPVHEARLRRAPRVAINTPAQPSSAKPVPPSERPASSNQPTSSTPVFGISMESTSSAGTGPAMAVGNTLQGKPRPEAETPEEGGHRLLAPVPAYEVTKMPLPKGECTGQYTSEAREAGLEGVVIFDLVVDQQGRARDIKVVQSLGAGLTEAAKRALQACAFTPGERDGRPVPVRIRSFKIRFTLRENE